MKNLYGPHVRKALGAAAEFVSRAEAAINESEAPGSEHQWLETSPKTSGALRRQSMELTRALAEMRKP